MKKLIIIFGLSVSFFSCNKDDGNNNPGTPQITDPTQSNTLTFDQVSHTEFLLWIGGEEINTSGLDLVDFFETPEHILSIETISLTFDQDSVEISSDDPLQAGSMKLA